MSATITADEIAPLLNLKRATFMRQRRDLIARGFPPPVPGCNSRAPVWSRLVVEAYIARGGIRPEPLPAADAVRLTLEARIGEG